jgi:hypothetical protein
MVFSFSLSLIHTHTHTHTHTNTPTQVICPLHMVWSRTPLAPTAGSGGDKGGRGGDRGSNGRDRQNSSKVDRDGNETTDMDSKDCTGTLSWTDWVWGTHKQPGLCRTLFSMVCNRREFVHIGGGSPINLSEWLLDYRAGSQPSTHEPDDMLASRLLALLHRRFAAHWLQVPGTPNPNKQTLAPNPQPEPGNGPPARVKGRNYPTRALLCASSSSHRSLRRRQRPFFRVIRTPCTEIYAP